MGKFVNFNSFQIPCSVDDFKVYAEDVGKPTGFEVMRDDTVSNGVSSLWGIDSVSDYGQTTVTLTKWPTDRD